MDCYRALIRRVGRFALTAFAVVGVSQAFAEGSRTLYPAGYNAAGFRSTMDARTTQRYMNTVSGRQFLYVYARAGEVILSGSSNRVGAGSGDILIYSPTGFGTRGDETRPATAAFQCSVTGTYAGAGRGIIANRAAELAGPHAADNSGVVGSSWSPCGFVVPATGIYGVQFTGSAGGANTPDGAVGTLQTNLLEQVAGWEVAVRSSVNSTTDLNGRVFTYAWVGYTGSNPRPVYYSLYYATADGYRYAQTFRGTDPNAAAFYANSRGFLDTGNALYKDVRGTGNTVNTSSFPANVTPQLPEYPVFFSDISPSGANATEAGRVLTALGISLTPPVPQLSNPAFLGNAGGNQSIVSGGGIFTFDTVNTLTYEIIISAGVDYNPANTLNRVLTGTALTGSHSVIWDGRRNDNTFFPAGNYNFRIIGRNGEIHFPMLDIERNANGGPSLIKLNGATPGDNIVYYDDRGYLTRSGSTIGVLNGHLCGAGNAQVQPTQNHSLLGVNSNDQDINGTGIYYRFWTAGGNTGPECLSNINEAFGNTKGLDLWALERTPQTILPVVIVAPGPDADVGAQITASASAQPGETVYGTLRYFNVSALNGATGVTYTTIIGTPGACPSNLQFTSLPAGVTTFTQNPATCAVTFTGIPANIGTQTSLFFNFQYTAPSTGPVPVSAAINSIEDPLGGSPRANQPVPNQASDSTDILVANVASVVSVPSTAPAGSTVNGSVVFNNAPTANITAENLAYSVTIGTAGSCPSGVTLTPPPPGPPTVTATYNASTCVVTLAGFPVELDPGQSVTLGFSYTAPLTGSVAVTSNITTTTPESNTTNNSTGTTTFTPSSDVAIDKSGTTSAPIGGTVTYSLVVWNNGPSVVNGATIADNVPTAISGVTWTCVGTGTATCSAPSGSGNAIALTANLPVDTGPTTTGDTQFVTVTISGTAAAPPASIVNSATVGVPGTHTDPTPGNNTDTQNTSITPVIDAVNDGPTNVSSAGGTTSAVTGNDTVNGATAATPGAGGNVALTPGTSPHLGLTMNASTGVITVASGTPPGTYAYPYTICLLPPNGSICDTATATVVVTPAIDAQDDGPVSVPASGGTTPSVLGNDVINGTTQATAGPGGNVVLTPGTSPNTGLTMNANTGVITVANGTPPGTYAYPYTICQVPPNATVCDNAIATVTVAPAIDAVDDGPTSVAASGGSTPSVLVNDRINGTTQATVGVGGNVTLTPGTPSNTGLTMNADGTITVAAGTPAGTYTYPYTICQLTPNQTVCDSATATVTVTGTIDAVDDGPTSVAASGGSTPSVLVNDRINGTTQATVGVGGNVTLTPGTPSNTGLTMNANGTITVAAGTPAGTYTYPYTICQVSPNQTVCDSATATVVVTGTIDALDDGPTTIAATGGNTSSVLDNDRINGTTPATVGAGGNVTLVPGTSPHVGLTMNPDGTITVAAGTPAGTYSYPYTICQAAPNDTVCDSANATVIVAAAPQLNVVKNATITIDGGTAGLADAGDVITYTVSVQNVGNIAIDSIVVTDSFEGGTAQTLTCTPTTLAPGASAACNTYTHTVTQAEVDAGQSLDNIATANGTDDDGTPVTDDDDASVSVPANAPQITVTKSAALTTDGGTPLEADAGDVITYTVSVQNTGNVSIASLVVTDSFEGGAAQTLSCTPTSLAPGATATCTAYTHTVTQAEMDAGGSLANVASASATAPGNVPVSDDDGADVPIGTLVPRITVTKTAAITTDNGTVGAADAGDVITYGVSVQNTGNVTVNSLGVTDSFEGGAAQTLTCSPTTLAPAQTATCTAYTHTVSQAEADAGTALNNVATAAAQSPSGASVGGSDDASVAVAASAPRLEVTKTASFSTDGGTAGLADVGDVISYAVSVRNTGNVTITNLTVSDSLEGRTATTLTCTPSTLAPQASATCNAYTHTVTQADVDGGGTLDNVATATGTGPGNTPVEDDGGSNVPIPAAGPQLTVTKTATLTTDGGTPDVADANDVITYTVTVQNTGNITVSDVSVTDRFEGGAPVFLTCTPSSTLAPGATATCTAYTHTVTQGEVNAGGTLDNIASASAIDPVGDPVTDEDDASVPLPVAGPQLTVTKTAVLTTDGGTPGIADANDVITYTVTVQNTGNITVSDIAVTDSFEGGAGVALNCSPTAVLAPGATATCTAYTHTVTQAEVDAGGTLDNVATAGGIDPVGDPVTDDDDASVPLPAAQPRLTVSKTATLSTDGGTTGIADAGDVITYAVSVQNSGNVRIDQLVVTDRFEGGAPTTLTCTPTALDPGQTATCTAYTHTVTQAEVDAGNALDNVALASGEDPSGNTVVDDDARLVPVPGSQAQLLVQKTATFTTDTGTLGLADVGDVIQYAVTVQNAGNVTVSGLLVRDVFEGGAPSTLTCTPTTLAPGATATCNVYSHTVTQAEVDAGGALDNVATASGTGPGNTPIGGTDDTSTPVAAGVPQLTVTKTATLSTDNGTLGVADAGDVITYGVSVQNSGNATIDSLVVTDSFEGGALVTLTCTPSTLAPGQSAVCTGYTHTVTQAEANAGGSLDNIATATGNDPADNPISDSDTTSTPSPGAAADLSIVKTASSLAPVVGSNITFTLTVANAGPSTATGVTVQDVLPAGYTFVSATASQGAYNTASGIWTVGTLANGAGATLSLTVTVNGTGPYANTATVDAPLPDPDPSDDSDTETPVPVPGGSGQADLGVVKTGPAQVDRGSNVAFTIVVTNRGPDTAINARLLDPTPPGLVFVSTSGACTGAFPCTLGNMAANESRTLVATYNVPANYSGPDMIVNTVNALSDSADPTPGDSSSSSSVIVIPGGGVAPVAPILVPVDARWAMALMALLMAGFAGLSLRRQRIGK